MVSSKGGSVVSCRLSGARCQVSGVRCQVSGVRCQQVVVSDRLGRCPVQVAVSDSRVVSREGLHDREKGIGNLCKEGCRMRHSRVVRRYLPIVTASLPGRSLGTTRLVPFLTGWAARRRTRCTSSPPVPYATIQVPTPSQRALRTDELFPVVRWSDRRSRGARRATAEGS